MASIRSSLANMKLLFVFIATALHQAYSFRQSLRKQSSQQSSSTSQSLIQEEFTQGTPVFNVGTTPTMANVVRNFVVVSDWDSGNDLASDVGMQHATTTFYLQILGGPLTITGANLQPALDSHVRAHLRGPLADRLKAVGSVGILAGETAALTVEYECLSIGDVNAMLTLNFEGLSPVSWSWHKKCGGEENSALMITGGYDNQKVMVQGVPRWDESHVIGTTTPKTKFALFVDPLSSENEIVISKPEATGRGSCSVTVSSPITTGTQLFGGTAGAAAVHYHCHSHGQCVVDVQVPFFPPMAPYRPAKFSLTKLCGGRAMGLDVDADTAGNKTHLATDGAPTYGTEELFVDPAVSNHKVFLINDMDRSDSKEVKIQRLQLQCLDSVRCVAAINGDLPRLIRGDKAANLDIGYTCLTSGSSLVQLLLEVEGHDPMKLHWTKDCSVWTDSMPGVMLFTFIGCLIVSCSCVGCMSMCSSKEGYEEEWEEGGEEEEGDS